MAVSDDLEPIKKSLTHRSNSKSKESDDDVILVQTVIPHPKSVAPTSVKIVQNITACVPKPKIEVKPQPPLLQQPPPPPPPQSIDEIESTTPPIPPGFKNKFVAVKTAAEQIKEKIQQQQDEQENKEKFKIKDVANKRSDWDMFAEQDIDSNFDVGCV